MTKPHLGRVLVLDDETELANALGEMLTGLGYQTTVVSSPDAAFRALAEQDFDVLLSDLVMPGGDGIEVLRKALAGDPHLIGIIMTGQATVHTAVEAMKVGAFDYLMKPFKLKALQPVLARAMGVRQLRLDNLQLRETLAIYELCQAIAFTLDPNTILNKVADAALQQAQADELSIMLPTREGKELYVAVVRGPNMELIPGEHVSAEQNMVGWVAQHHEPLLLHGEVQDPRFAPLQPRPDIHSALSLPMLVGNRLIGVLNANRTQSRRPFRLGQVKALSILAGTAAAALEAAWLHEQVRQQAALIDKATDAILVLDLHDRIVFWNQGAERLSGWTAAEAAGKRMDEFVSPSSRPALDEAHRGLILRGEWTGELRQTAKAGKEIVVTSRWTVVRDSEGRAASCLVINTDLTEKKNLENQLLHTQRLESIGTLAGGIAHDLNNVLTPILMAVQLLQTRLADTASQSVLGILQTSAERGADLVKQVLLFARGTQGQRQALPLRPLLVEIGKFLQGTFPKAIDSQVQVPKDLWAVSGNITQLHQVLMNLCVNARDAMPGGGRLTVTAKNQLLDENYARMNPEAKPGPYVALTVEDTGTGIPADIRDRIFEPFFTTKEPGKGTGLGLATVREIVKSHDGFINVYSEAGKGTRFIAYLPALETAETRPTGEVRRELPLGTGELILVVDDEASIREITKATLEVSGYRVLAAQDGTEALALYAQHPGEVRAVLTDMMMPILDGLATIRALRKMDPEVRIIASSGLTENAKAAEASTAGARAFLPKPYTADQLLITLSEVLRTG